jgi:chromosome partitioning protein
MRTIAIISQKGGAGKTTLSVHLATAAGGLASRGAAVAPVMLCQRVAFTHGVIDGRTAQEFEPEGKAAEEIESLYTWLCGIVGMPTRGHVRKAA